MAVLFNYIPGTSAFRAPGRYVEFNSGGQFVSITPTILIGACAPKLTLWSGAPIVCDSLEMAARYTGAGSPLYEMYRLARKNDSIGEIWIADQPVTGTAAIFTVTLAALPATGGAWSLEIAGRRIAGVAVPGETLAATAAAVAAAINAFVDPLEKAYLPVTATSAAGVVTLTARGPGAYMNALDIWTDALSPDNIFGPSGRFTVANPTPGAGVLDATTPLSLLGDQIYGLIISQAGDATSINAAKSLLNQTSGRWSFDAPTFGVFASIVTGSTSAQATAGQAPNSEFVALVGRPATPTPDYEFAAAYFAAQASWLYDDANGNVGRNQSGRVAMGIRPPRDRASWPSRTTTRNTLINAGVSTWSVNAAGEVAVDKAVTTRRLNAQGQPDIEFSNLQRMFIVMHFIRLWLAEMSYRSANRALVARNDSNLPALYTPDDGRADHIAVLFEAEKRGLIENARGAIPHVRVEIDTANPSRLNFASTVDGVDPLDILAANITFRRLAA
jgi:phage tail sheath gpL-like